LSQNPKTPHVKLINLISEKNNQKLQNGQ